MKPGCAWLLLVISGFAGSAVGQDGKAQSAMVLKKAIEAMDAYASEAEGWQGFSGVLVVEQGGKRLYARTFGQSNLEKRIPITLETPFLIASQGKMFTAVGILQLVEAGKVNLDDPVGKYLRDCPNREVAERITIRHLLTHRGGTGDIGVLERGEGENRAWVRTIDDLLKLNGSRPPAFEPGSKFEYSNYGFVLLGAVIERVSGMSYYDYLDRHVFRPAGMRHTGYPIRDRMDGVAIGYTWINKELRPSTQWLPWRASPAGGGVSTAGDELRFFAALNAGKLLSKSTLVEATRLGAGWGLGFAVSGPEQFPHWGHGGGAPGNSLASSYWPRADLTTICMSNLDPPACDHVMYQFFKTLAPAYGASF